MKRAPSPPSIVGTSAWLAETLRRFEALDGGPCRVFLETRHGHEERLEEVVYLPNVDIETGEFRGRGRFVLKTTRSLHDGD